MESFPTLTMSLFYWTLEMEKDVHFTKKRVDESWKESAAHEKERLDEMLKTDPAKKNPSSGASAQPSSPPPKSEKKTETPSPSPGEQADEPSASNKELEMSFLNYVASLGYQAMIFLGEIPHPVSQQIEKNTDQAKFLIDTLALLREKTKGNLSAQEQNLLNGTLYELQMKYVEIMQKSQGPG